MGAIDFGVIGAGAWGTALAQSLARTGATVRLWMRDPSLVRLLETRKENSRYLPGVPLLAGIDFTDRLAEVAETRKAILLVTPSHALRSVCRHLSPFLPPDSSVPLILATKGLDSETDRPLSELLEDLFPTHPIAVLSGPNFAKEVALGLPSATVIAARDIAFASRLAEQMGTPNFRPYASSDPLGVAFCGAFKNVLAIACGVAEGRQLGDNARAALITRGIAELSRLGKPLGIQAETLNGLSGLGDIVLTCTSLQSRNYTLGIALGQGQKLRDILDQRRSIAEGVYAAEILHRMALKAELDMPIVTAVDLFLRGDFGIDDSIARLLTRPLRRET